MKPSVRSVIIMALMPVITLILCTIPTTDSLSQPVPRYDLSRIPVLYTVGYAHLDTEWRWDYPVTINTYLKNTLDDNFVRFRKYPEYVFSFTGSRRYRMMKEYYPDKYAELKRWVARDRWFVSGSSVDECDPNVPSPESVIRQVLYGNQYFRKEFGKESVDFMLPDCFGFQAHFPGVLNHCGLKGFSTQKLSWGSAVGIPFNLGLWVGPDGGGIVSALNATSYTSHIQERLDTSAYWTNRVTENGRKYGLYTDYRYYGVGDVGGAPREEDIRNAIGSLDHPDSKIQVYLSSSDQLFRDLTPAQTERLPAYSGDLLLTEHSSGSITSQAYMKRWNRKNEWLARSAEPLAVMAQLLGKLPYPKETLEEAWWLLLGCQMHDILPGTSLPSAYPYAWNDEVLAMNLFSSVLTHSAEAVIGSMDTRGDGTPVVVYNPVAIEREDVVEATLQYPEGAPSYVVVTGPGGDTVPSQVTSSTKTTLTLLFLARVPSVGLATYHVRESRRPVVQPNTLQAGRLTLENHRYRVMIQSNGDIHSIHDKLLGKELLSANATLEFLHEHPDYWPAWNMDWSDRQQPPIGTVTGQATTTLVENGPVRITYRIDRHSRGSEFSQWISLTAGAAGSRLMIRNQVAWLSRGVSLKADFPLTVGNRMATYNLGFGTIERPTNEPKKYEVPSREWFDLTDASGKYGITILEDSKFGSDKPNDSTLRLTLLYTPVTNEYHDQATQDWGIHDFTYGICGHEGDWRKGLSEWQGQSVNQPLLAFQTTAHSGPLGGHLSIATLDTAQVDIRAIKQQENGMGVIVRIQELFGKPLRQVTLSLPFPIRKAQAVDGQERVLSDLTPIGGNLRLNLSPFEMKTLLLTLDAGSDSLFRAAGEPLSGQTGDAFPIQATIVPMLYDTDVVSGDSNRTDGRFGPTGISYPAELFPSTLTLHGIPFTLGGTLERQMNALSCNGQKITLPKQVREGQYNKLYLLAAATHDTTSELRLGKTRTPFAVQGFSGYIGQYDNRVWDQFNQVIRIDKGFIKPDEVAAYTPHLHSDTANIAYAYGYLFLYAFDLDPSMETVQFPVNPDIRIFAMTVACQPWPDAIPVTPLHDDFSGRPTLRPDLSRRYVTASMQPTADVTATRKPTVEELPEKVSISDYASVLMPNGVTVNYLGSETDEHYPKPYTLLPITAFTDGMFDLLPEDTALDRWFPEGEGRILIDLQKEILIDSIHLFSALNRDRGAPAFSLWGYPDALLPSLSGNPASQSWGFITYAEPLDLWSGGVSLHRIISATRNQYRYLLIISENAGHGPVWFREIDVFEKQR